MRVRTRLTALLVAVATASALTACGQDDDGPVDNVPTVTPATAAQSPPATVPTGTVIDAVAARTLVAGRGADAPTALLAADGRSVTLFSSPGSPTAPAPRTVAVPELGALGTVGDGFVGAGRAGLVRIAPDGQVSEQRVDLGTVLSVAATADGRILVGNDRGQLLVVDGEGAIARRIGGFVRVDDITVAPASAEGIAGQVVVLDRAQSAVIPVDIESGELKAALRSGDGATEAIVDPYGRILVTGTRTDEIFAFYGQPILMRLRAPVPKSPYALVFDEQRKLLWVSSTASNVITGFDLSTGEAKERHRLASIRQVVAMDFDAQGRLVIASGREGALQVVDLSGTP